MLWVLSFLLKLQLEYYFSLSLSLVPTLQERIAQKKTIIKKRSPTWSQTGTAPEAALPRRPNRSGGSRLWAGGTLSAPPPLASTCSRWRMAGAHFRFRCKSPGRGGGKMAVAVGVRGRCELPPCSSPGWFLSLSALLSVAARGAFATTHWVVTEDGKSQQQVAARVPLSVRPRPPSPGGERFPKPAWPLAVWLRTAPPPAYLPAVRVSGFGRPPRSDPPIPR